MAISRRAGRILAVLSGCVLALICAEFACRLDVLFPGTHYDSDSARVFFEVRAEPHAVADMRAYGRPDPQIAEADALPFVHPFAAWTNGSTDEYAAQMARETSAAGDEFFDLLVLGGSVAGNFSHAGTPRLVELLEADPRLAGRRMRVWGFARASYRAMQQLGWCQWLLALGARPDAVLVIDGFNDVAMALVNSRRGLHPSYPSFQYWVTIARGVTFDPVALDLAADVRIARRAQIEIAARARDRGYHRSALLTRWTQWRLRESKRAVDAASARLFVHQGAITAGEPSMRGPPFAGDDRAAVALAVASWESAARSLHAVCTDRGIPCFQVVQPTLADAGGKRASAEELRTGAAIPEWADGVALGYPLLREGADRLRVEGLAVADATRIFADVEETLYKDVVHVDDRGNVRLAEWIAPRLLERLR